MSAASIETALAAAIVALSGSPVRLTSDLRDDLQAVADGVTVFALVVAQKADSDSLSNAPKIVIDCSVAMHHRLGDAEAERTYTSGEAHTHRVSLCSTAWWRAIVGIHALLEGPELQDGPERSGRIITYTVAAQFTAN